MFDTEGIAVAGKAAGLPGRFGRHTGWKAQVHRDVLRAVAELMGRIQQGLVLRVMGKLAVHAVALFDVIEALLVGFFQKMRIAVAGRPLF